MVTPQARFRQRPEKGVHLNQPAGHRSPLHLAGLPTRLRRMQSRPNKVQEIASAGRDVSPTDSPVGPCQRAATALTAVPRVPPRPLSDVRSFGTPTAPALTTTARASTAKVRGCGRLTT